MLDWLVNYGVQQHTAKYEDVDVNDRLALQEQINSARKNWHSLISLLDDIQGKYINVMKKIAELVKKTNEKAVKEGVRVNSLLAVDEEYIALDAQQHALSAGISMVKEQIDFYKNDLRILNSVFYNKF